MGFIRWIYSLFGHSPSFSTKKYENMSPAELESEFKKMHKDKLIDVSKKQRRGIELFPCPSCGFLTFEEALGSYDICPLCGWEDDALQTSIPTSDIGANHPGLLKWQSEALNELPPELKIYKGIKRCEDWRPLCQSDLQNLPPAPDSGLSYFHALSSDQDDGDYYWRKPKP